jgi:hypothetical protein
MAENTTELEKYGKTTPMKKQKRKHKYYGQGDSGEILEARKVYFSKPENSNGKLTTLNEDLITEICEYLMLGATNIVICRVIGVHKETFSHWIAMGKSCMLEDADVDPIYGLLYSKYEEYRGRRVLSWLEKIKDPKWLITRHPDTKQEWAELRYQKNELSGEITAGESSARQVEAEKRIGLAIENVRSQSGRRLSDKEDNGEILEEPRTPDGEGSE